jgi:hypothetical protein
VWFLKDGAEFPANSSCEKDDIIFSPNFERVISVTWIEKRHVTKMQASKRHYCMSIVRRVSRLQMIWYVD